MREILCGRRVLRYSAVAATMMVAAPCLAGEGMITAVIDQARLIKIPAGTQTLVIGNPTVADVTLIKQNNLMILSPKAFGDRIIRLFCLMSVTSATVGLPITSV